MLKEKIKNNKILAGSLLSLFVAANIYPIGCFSWDGGASSSIIVNKDSLISSLNCVIENKNSEADLKKAQTLLAETDGNPDSSHSIMLRDYDYFEANYTECEFDKALLL